LGRVAAPVTRAGERMERVDCCVRQRWRGRTASFVVPVAHLTTGGEWFDAVPWGVILGRTRTGE
jgi:hypothetical protein